MALEAHGSDPAEWSGKFITFHYNPQPDRKTDIWDVCNSGDGGFLGHVRWFGRWRKYCFFPAGDCVLEEVCLGDISQFIVDRTKEHRDGI